MVRWSVILRYTPVGRRDEAWRVSSTVCSPGKSPLEYRGEGAEDVYGGGVSCPILHDLV